jgi:hypothetical protein
MKTWVAVTLAVGTFIAGAAVGTAAGGSAPEVRAVTKTVTASPVVITETVTAAPEPAPQGDDAPTEACALLMSAQNVPAGTDRWIDRVLEAEDKPMSDAMYSAVDNAYWATDDGEALSKVITRFC